MGTSVVIDDNLLAEARRLTGLKETSDVMREALRALIERESARRLARLGGSEPELRERQRANTSIQPKPAPSRPSLPRRHLLRPLGSAGRRNGPTSFDRAQDTPGRAPHTSVGPAA